MAYKGPLARPLVAPPVRARWSPPASSVCRLAGHLSYLCLHTPLAAMLQACPTLMWASWACKRPECRASATRSSAAGCILAKRSPPARTSRARNLFQNHDKTAEAHSFTLLQGAARRLTPDHLAYFVDANFRGGNVVLAGERKGQTCQEAETEQPPRPAVVRHKGPRDKLLAV